METFNEIISTWYLFVNSNLEIITLTVIVVLLTGMVFKILKQDAIIKDLYEIAEDNWIYTSQIGLDRAINACIEKGKKKAERAKKAKKK